MVDIIPKPLIKLMTSAIKQRRKCQLFCCIENYFLCNKNALHSVQRRKIMLLSISMIMMFGLLLSTLCRKVKLPGLLGMLATGIVLGPYVSNVIDNIFRAHRHYVYRCFAAAI